MVLLNQFGTDMVACLFMVVMLPIVYIYELGTVLPTIHPAHTIGFYLHIVAATYVLATIFGNLFLILRTDTTTHATGVILPSILKKGWRFCSYCEYNAPPRSFHCHQCNKCILKRDHHCVFTGNCVGYANHRYYLSMIVWICLGTLYSNILNFDYTWEVLGGLTWRSLFSMVLPLVSWLFGVTHAFTFYVALVSSLCVIVFFLMVALVVYHSMLISKGQTVFELNHKIKDYNYGWKANITEALGKNWYLAWINPLIPSPLPGNGIDWPKGIGPEEVKDM